MKFHTLPGKRVLVLGLGVHGGGVAVARWLVRQGAHVTVSDIKTRRELVASLRQLQGLPIRYVLGAHPRALLKGCDMVVQNPGVPAGQALLREARRQGIVIENEASLFFKLAHPQLVIGVTGSKGKSTVTALLGAMLQRWNARTLVAGNIRDATMFQVIGQVTPKTPIVLELSSWHLEVMGQHHLSPGFAVVTNVLPDHLNRYRSMAAYAQAKAQIFLHQTPQGAVVLNYDNPVTRRFAQIARSRVYWFSLKHAVSRGCYLTQARAWWRESATRQELFRVSDLAIPGEHNLADALAAAAAAKLAGVPPRTIRAAVRTFHGLHDRLELVRTIRGVTFYNDTTSTTPVSTQAALRAFAPSPLVLIAGGADKALPYRVLARDIRRYVHALVLLPGTATAKLQRELKGYRPQFLASGMPQAVRLATKLAPTGSVVLLSPGAASFGLFAHEFERGRAFVRAVRSLR